MELTEKLSLIQQKMKAPKNLYNKFGNYAYRNAEGILEAFKPFEAEHKVALTITDDMSVIGDRVYVKAIARLMDCESQETIVTTAFAREASEKKGMDDAQITGAASSYARKYALNGLFLLDDTKDADTDESHEEEQNRNRTNAKNTSTKKASGTKNTQTDVPNNESIGMLRNQLVEECMRTGRGKLFLKKQYAVENPEDLSESQLEDAIAMLKQMPDKKVS